MPVGSLMKQGPVAAICSILLLFSVLAPACQPAPAGAGGKKSIVATYSILGAVVKELVGDAAVVTVSIPNGLDPHEWSPSAKDIETINKADLVFENGLGLEGGMLKTLNVARNNGVKFFTATDHITVRHVGPGEGIPSGDPDQAIGAPDPHFWMDPLAVKSVARALADELMKDFNMDVSSRAKDLEGRLDGLNSEVAAQVAAIPAGDRKLVTGHESMGYFAQRYGFKLVGVIVPSLSSQAQPSAAELAGLKRTIQDNHVRAIFTELGSSPAVAQALGDQTGVKVVELTTHAVPPDGSYLTFLRNVAAVIANGLK